MTNLQHLIAEEHAIMSADPIVEARDNGSSGAAARTLREHYAGLMLAALLSQPGSYRAEVIAGEAVQLADALLLALERSRRPEPIQPPGEMPF